MFKKINKEKGFTLIECLVAMVITLIGLLAVFQLIAYSLNIEQFASRSTAATKIAVNKIEELKLSALTDGGSLITDTSGFSDTSNDLYTVRWTVSNGTAGVETKHIIVEVAPRTQVTQNSTVRLETYIR